MQNFIAQLTPFDLAITLVCVSMLLGLGWSIGVKVFDDTHTLIIGCIILCVVIFKKIKNAIRN
ncbi:hypothetical protein VH441_07375 [Psychrobacter sp. HD31]|uniref:hypothetical protein n=1 Tax=Psychrobacter sp. HD31 TaxID=3112003 RepID=UPI003DA4FA31